MPHQAMRAYYTVFLQKRQRFALNSPQLLIPLASEFLLYFQERLLDQFVL